MLEEALVTRGISMCGDSYVYKTPRTYVSIYRDLNFQIHIGIRLSNTGDKLVYYYLYNEETSFPLDVCPCLINFNFIVFIQTQYLSI